jgi:hypothetical protein
MLGLGSSIVHSNSVGGSFSPDNIDDLIAWYDMTDSTKIYTTHTGSTNVSVNDNVGSVANKAPDKTLSQAYKRFGVRAVSRDISSPNNPSQGGVFKGSDGIYFSGGTNTGPFLWCVNGVQGAQDNVAGGQGEFSSTLLDSENCTYFVVLKPEDNTISGGDQGIMGFVGRNNSNDNGACMYLTRLNSNESIHVKYVWEGDDVSDDEISGTVNIGTDKQILEIWSNSTLQTDIQVEKHEVDGGSGTLVGGNLDPDQGGGVFKFTQTDAVSEIGAGTVGDAFIMGANLDETGMHDNRCFKGHILEVLVYNDYLTQSERANVVDYLQNKHG